MKYLLAAEVDKIQELIFQAIRQKEITGGSQLLTEWCRRMAEEMQRDGVPPEDIIVADGGAFRVIFSDKEKCRLWGELLAEYYWRETGGTLTVVEPLQFEEADFTAASVEAQRRLRVEKMHPPNASACIHNPFLAYCDICGHGFGSKRESSEGKTVCSGCSARFDHIKDISHSLFVQTLIKDISHSLFVQTLAADLEINRQVDYFGSFDVHTNVAYLVADGNNMGVLFSKCSKEQMRKVSLRLPEIIAGSLSAATVKLINRLIQDEKFKIKGLPVLPLIMGGDDLCVLLAAPYSFDFARQFVQHYISELNAFLAGIGVRDFAAGMCVGLVVCKASYPHTLAYEQASRMLERAKTAARMQGASLSLISFTKGATAAEEPDKPGKLLNTLQTYHLRDESTGSILPLLDLLECREILKDVPGSRLAAIHELYDQAILPSPNDYDNEKRKDWLKRLDYQLDRAGRKPQDRDNLGKALHRLGSADPDFLYMRSAEHINDGVWGTGFGDLMDFWDYTLGMDLKGKVQDL